MFFYSETELLHNTAEMVGMKMGLMGIKGVSFWFLLYVTNIIVLLKTQDSFSNTVLCLLQGVCGSNNEQRIVALQTWL